MTGIAYISIEKSSTCSSKIQCSNSSRSQQQHYKVTAPTFAAASAPTDAFVKIISNVNKPV
jgi:hypothetical protein